MAPPDRGSFSPIGRMLLATAAAVAVLAGMRVAAPILAPVVIALVITIAWSPAAEWLRERGVNPTLAATAGIVAGLVVLGLLVALVWISLLQLQDKLPEYQPKIAALQATLTEKLRIIPIDSSRIFSVETFQPGNLVGYAVRIIRRLTETAGNLLILALLIAFMMLEAIGFPAKLRSAFASNPPVLESFHKLGEGIKSYVLINAVFGLAAAVVNTALLLALGVDFAFLWGVLSFLLSFVPNIGFIIALIPPALLTLIEFGFARAFIVLGGYTLINFLVDNVIKPRFVGQTLGLSPLMVVLSLLFWGWLLGPLGALIAIPLSIGLKLLLESFEESRWMAELMSDRPSGSNEPSGDVTP
ncbi:MAG TPA: AI-2E family transporter [Gemmatimonadaceae bacterium]|nr:AI-2E family transporter [Gemmatimonadaceae bacterium]